MIVNIGKGIELDCPDTFTADVTAHIMRIGLRNILMDSHASVTAEKVGDGGDVVAESKAVAEKKLAALIAGDLRTSATRISDPVKKEAMRLAIAAVEAALKKADKKADAKVVRAKAETVVERFMVQARKNVEAVAAIDLDLDV
jgi:hypothetical protein